MHRDPKTPPQELTTDLFNLYWLKPLFFAKSVHGTELNPTFEYAHMWVWPQVPVGGNSSTPQDTPPRQHRRGVGGRGRGGPSKAHLGPDPHLGAINTSPSFQFPLSPTVHVAYHVAIVCQSLFPLSGQTLAKR